jgi:hypothetical protein
MEISELYGVDTVGSLVTTGEVYITTALWAIAFTGA